MEVLELPLYNEPDYSYDVSLNRTSYTIRMFYNERSRSWHMDLQDQEGEYIFQGVRIAEETPLYSNNTSGDTTTTTTEDNGYFYLMPVGETRTLSIGCRDPYRIDRWCKLYYLFPEGNKLT